MMPYFKLGMDKKVIVPYADYLAAMKPDFKYVGDQEELVDVVRCLHLPSANSVKIVGKRGTGCTALMDGLVQNQNADFMPDEFMVRPIYFLNSSNLFNTSDTKEMEARFRAALEDLKRQSQQRAVKPILMVDDGYNFVASAPQHVINSLIEAAIVADFMDIVIKVDEKKENDFDVKHPEFKNSFTVKKVSEPNKELLFKIAKYQAQQHEKHGVIIDNDVIQHAIDITERFKGLYDTAQPNRVMRLIDSAATSFRMDIHSRAPGSRAKEEMLDSLKIQLEGLEEQSSPEAESLKSQIETLTIEMANDLEAWNEHRNKIKAKQDSIKKFDILIAENQAEIDKLNEATKETHYTDIKNHIKTLSDGDADLKGRRKEEVLKLDRESLLSFAEFDMNIERSPKVRELTKEISQNTENVKRLQADLEKLSQEMHIQEEMPSSFVDSIASKALGGAPVGGINGQIYKNIKNGSDLMKRTVFGQDRVIDKIIRPLKRAAAGLRDPNRPLGVFMVAGPPGNGKTYTGEQLAEQVFGSAEYCRTIPMQSYMEKHTVSRLLSAPPGYAGYEEKALLAEIGQTMPFGVLILDELEKAHPDILQALLRVMDKGQFTALNGDEADFRNIILYSTTNYAQDIWDNNDVETGEKLLKERMETEGHFSKEFVDRHDEIIGTAFLDKKALSNIVKKEIKTIKKEISRNNPNLVINLQESDLDTYVTKYPYNQSGRGTKRDVRSFLGDFLTDIILDDPKASGIVVGSLNQSTGQFDFDYKKGAVPANDMAQAGQTLGLAPEFAKLERG
ncbi:MAG: AAA family ATPase [Alphaproteobacteria bacterium]|nr:AAA family ATPase [Alphaproteobacteria bacterium]